MSRSLRRTSSLALALAPALALASAAPATERLVDGIAAQVGSQIVLLSEVLRTVAPQEAALRAAGAPRSEIAKLRADGLEQAIESRLIQNVVKQSELYASDAEVDETIQRIADENGLTMEQLQASVVFHGLSIPEYRQQIKADLERRNVVNAVVGQNVKVEEDEVRALYEERFADQPQGGTAVHVRQLLISYGGMSRRDPETACAEAEAARQRVLGGESFEKVASEVSEVAPKDGGDIGWLHLDTVAPWMSEALAPLEPGGTSDVLQLPFGCSLLHLVEQREFEPISFENAKDHLASELWERKVDEAYREWIEELRDHTYIDRRGYFAEAARFGERTFPIDEPALPAPSTP